MIEDYRVSHPHDHGAAFRFCPICGGVLESRLLKSGDPSRLVCTACAFVFYLDPKLEEDTYLKKIGEVTLSYTFFQVENDPKDVTGTDLNVGQVAPAKSPAEAGQSDGS